MPYTVSYGYAVVDAVWFDGEGMGHGVRGLLIDRVNAKPIEVESRCGLTRIGSTELFGWGICDGSCAYIEREEGVGHYAVPGDQWAKVEAWLGGQS
jgi:hypothetical protein